MTLKDSVKDLKEKVREKRQRDKLLKEHQKLQEELEKGSIKGLAKKGLKKLWNQF
ncbi:hypothetical protein LCGC14_1351220 [marine sediment metagenome]|uniref:Uncharacterized protein n=1 Tax=marine sediment metagenome TaxID=412755 RepID=A0A0F9KBK9_9ZZZZ